MLYKAKYYLNKRSLLVLYYSFIRIYSNYANIAWGSTNRTNIKKINSLQKDAIRIIHCKSRFAHARHLFRKCKILNVFQLNILDNLVFMHQISNSTKNSFSHEQLFLWTHVLTPSENLWCHNRKLRKKSKIHTLPNISRSKGTQTIKFGHLLEYDTRNIFLEKSYN